MSTAGTIRRRVLITGADNPAYQVSKTVANDSLVIASAAPNGSVLVADSAQADGWGFDPIPAAAAGTLTGATLAANVLASSLTSVGTLTDLTVAGYVQAAGLTRASAQFDKTSSSTLADVPGLSVAVEAGKTYVFTATLYTASGSSGGVKVAIAGTCTATAVIYDGVSHEGNSTNTKQRSTALGGAVAALTGATTALLRVNGTITVNAAGTLTVQFAQNAINGTTSSVLVGSTFSVQLVA